MEFKKPGISLVGNIFGKLKVISFFGYQGKRKMWSCICECGGSKNVQQDHLKTGHTKSCGCISRDKQNNLIDTNGNLYSILSSEYKAWQSMKARCYNMNGKHYNRYGGRGITVCAEWLEFKNFISDMGPKPAAKLSLERINNELGYFPGNCIWADSTIQNRNRSNVKLITFEGSTMSITAWAKELGIEPQAIRGRINRGWSVQEALLRPIDTAKGHGLGGRSKSK